MKLRILCMSVFLLASEDPRGAEVPAPATAAKTTFDPYTPEESAGQEKSIDVKLFKFSKRQLEHIASMEFDQEKFAKHLQAKWTMKKLIEFTKASPRAKNDVGQTGYKAAIFFKVGVYEGIKHDFDSITVTVFDQYGAGGSIWPDQSHPAGPNSAKGAEVKRWAWMISINEGKRSWSIQEELPNLQFEKKKAN